METQSAASAVSAPVMSWEQTQKSMDLMKFMKNVCFIFSASLATERQGNAIVCPMLLEITALSARRITGRLQVERAVTPVLVTQLVTMSWDYVKRIYYNHQDLMGRTATCTQASVTVSLASVDGSAINAR